MTGEWAGKLEKTEPLVVVLNSKNISCGLRRDLHKLGVDAHLFHVLDEGETEYGNDEVDEYDPVESVLHIDNYEIWHNPDGVGDNSAGTKRDIEFRAIRTKSEESGNAHRPHVILFPFSIHFETEDMQHCIRTAKHCFPKAHLLVTAGVKPEMLGEAMFRQVTIIPSCNDAPGIKAAIEKAIAEKQITQS